MNQMHIPLLRRVGAVLLAAGLITLAALALESFQGMAAFTAGPGLVAVVAGVGLWRGNLRAALGVRWLAAFLLAAGLSLLFFLPLMQPFSLTFAQLRLGQGPSLSLLVAAVLGVLGLGWIVWQLGRAPIDAARTDAGLQPRDMRIPAAAGVALVVALGVFLVAMRVGASAHQARALAEQKVGEGYRFHISWVSRVRTGTMSQMSAVVIAWNDNEVRRIPVQWEAP